MKIAVYAIAKNEEKFVERFYASIKDADYVLIADTGSTDKTVEIAKACGIIVHQISVMPWRFDVAKNAALSLLPNDIDVCINLDLDEIMTQGWRSEIESLWSSDVTRLMYLYKWNFENSFFTNKIHSRHGYRWMYPCHEWIVFDSRYVEKQIYTDKCLIEHYADETKGRNQYLELLKLGILENPENPERSFYYGRELFFHRKLNEAIEELKRYLALPKANSKFERAMVCTYIGRCFTNLSKFDDAKSWFEIAIQEFQDKKEPWVDLADLYRISENWLLALISAEKAISINVNQHKWPYDGEAWGFKPYDIAALAAYYLKDYEKALLYGEKCVKLAPNNKRLLDNLRWYLSKVQS